MLYEVITAVADRELDARLGVGVRGHLEPARLGLGADGLDLLRREVLVLEPVPGGSHAGARAELDEVGVITSYSIHYTKLYDSYQWRLAAELADHALGFGQRRAHGLV